LPNTYTIEDFLPEWKTGSRLDSANPGLVPVFAIQFVDHYHIG